MTATAIIQARMGSTRLPGKAMKPLAGHPMLWHVVQRVRATRGLAQVVVATPQASDNDVIRAFCAREGIAVFSGSDADVLDRYYQAALAFAADPVIRVTSDCPFVDPGLTGRLITLFAEGRHDYACLATNQIPGAFGVKGYPDGLDVECFSLEALRRAWSEAKAQPDREHVTPYLWGNRDAFDCGVLASDQDLTDLRLTVDQPEDLAVVERVYEALYRDDRPVFSFDDVLSFLTEHPDVAKHARDPNCKERP